MTYDNGRGGSDLIFRCVPSLEIFWKKYCFKFVHSTTLEKFSFKASPPLLYADSQENHLFRAAIQTFFFIAGHS